MCINTEKDFTAFFFPIAMVPNDHGKNPEMESTEENIQ